MCRTCCADYSPLAQEPGSESLIGTATRCGVAPLSAAHIAVPALLSLYSALEYPLGTFGSLTVYCPFIIFRCTRRLLRLFGPSDSNLGTEGA